MPLSTLKFQALVDACSLSFKHLINQNEFDEDVYIIEMYCKDFKIGQCTFIQREASVPTFHIIRIDIDVNYQKNGYGALLLYKTLIEIEKKGAEKCTLTGFNINSGFYFRNGFFPEDVECDKQKWFSLALQERKELLYSQCNTFKVSREEFFSDSTDHVPMLFEFTAVTINELVKSLEYAEYRLCLSKVLNEISSLFSFLGKDNLEGLLNYIHWLHHSLENIKENRTTTFLAEVEKYYILDDTWLRFFKNPSRDKVEKPSEVQFFHSSEINCPSN